MIGAAYIARWRLHAPWPTREQVEQDLVLSRLVVEIANHPLLGQELVFRGGTCLHKLWLERPWRYSEDLDYVRRTAGPIGPALDALREVAASVGFDRVRTAVGRFPKVRFGGDFLDGGRMSVKVEINTFERTPALPLAERPFTVDNPWFSGSAEVATFALEELAATKIRALYQRAKGRDLFDLWLATSVGGARPSDIADCFQTYQPAGWTTAAAAVNLDTILHSQEVPFYPGRRPPLHTAILPGQKGTSPHFQPRHPQPIGGSRLNARRSKLYVGSISNGSHLRTT